MTKAANFSVKIGWMISLIGVFIFFVPFPVSKMYIKDLLKKITHMQFFERQETVQKI